MDAPFGNWQLFVFELFCGYVWEAYWRDGPPAYGFRDHGGDIRQILAVGE
jgi:hypothetical protein